MLKPLTLQSNTTHEIAQQISRKLLRMDVLTFETCWALNNEIIKQVALSWSIFSQLLSWFIYLGLPSLLVLFSWGVDCLLFSFFSTRITLFPVFCLFRDQFGHAALNSVLFSVRKDDRRHKPQLNPSLNACSFSNSRSYWNTQRRGMNSSPLVLSSKSKILYISINWGILGVFNATPAFTFRVLCTEEFTTAVNSRYTFFRYVTPHQWVIGSRQYEAT